MANITYSYTALEASGKRRSGFIDATDLETAKRMVQADGRYILEIAEQKVAKTSTSYGKGKVTRADVALFTRRMADLAAAGLPLDRVLRVVAEQSENPTLSEVASEVLRDVQSGQPISDSLAKHPKYFPIVYTQTLKAGEASGQFPEVATRLADFQETEVARRSQIVSAMIYPAILAITAVGVVIFLLLFVVPRLQGIFKDLGNDLPVPTVILLATTSFLTNNGLLLSGILIGAIILYRGWVATEAGALARDAWIMRLPTVGPVVQKATVSRFARVLGTLVYGGVPILEALELSGMAAGNKQFLRSARQVQMEVQDGRGIADAMRDAGTFPPVLTNMVAVGEETGDLPKMLGRVSDSLDFEVDNGVKRLTALVEPIIVLGMGGFVGFVVLSVLLPIFAAQDLAK